MMKKMKILTTLMLVKTILNDCDPGIQVVSLPDDDGKLPVICNSLSNNKQELLSCTS